MSVNSFTHRLVSGWLTDFSSRPLLEPWPSIRLDNGIVGDVRHAIGRCKDAGYTGLIMWGLAAGRSWASALDDTVSPARRDVILSLIADVRAAGLTAYFGLGLYSWGFDAIIEGHPELDGGSRSNMCASRPASWEWMQKVVDFVMQQFDPDGVSMQSSDQGRCGCDQCQQMGALEYHAAVNDKVAGYIRSRWPDKRIHISTWGMDLGNSREIDHVRQMTRHADVLNDFNNSAVKGGRENRRALISALGCAYGTEQGFWFDPPPFWRRDKWFLHFGACNLPYWCELKADGADQIERYILPLANPGAEIGFLFDGAMLSDLSRDPSNALREAIGTVFETDVAADIDGLQEIAERAERAFLAAISQPERFRQITSSRVHYDVPYPSARQADRPEYLFKLAPDKLGPYAEAMRLCRDQALKLAPGLAKRDKARALVQSIQGALNDIELAYGRLI